MRGCAGPAFWAGKLGTFPRLWATFPRTPPNLSWTPFTCPRAQLQLATSARALDNRRRFRLACWAGPATTIPRSNFVLRHRCLKLSKRQAAILFQPHLEAENIRLGFLPRSVWSKQTRSGLLPPNPTLPPMQNFVADPPPPPPSLGGAANRCRGGSRLSAAPTEGAPQNELRTLP